ncbi:hypothetical protein OIU76_022111 [Salix suchowensis]|nr:hypothetical protein OIU76_022111 [Salix suchowensis]
MVRPPWCDKLNGKKGPWTADEDSKMLAHVAKHGTGNWTAVPKKAADYGNIGGHVKSGSRIGSLSRDLKNVFTVKPEKYNSIIPEGISNIDGHLMTTMLPPKMEPVQECFLNKFNNDSINGNHSLDLLYQLQAIKMVTEASGTCAEYQTMLEPNHSVFDEGSSSSSTCSIEARENLPTSSSWCDFLLEDQFLPSDPQEEQENAAELSSKDLTNQAQNVIVTSHGQNPRMMKPKCDQIIAEVNVGVDLTVQSNTGFVDQVAPSSSQHSSFVETIIDGENKIFLDFPNLLEELFNY